MSCTKRAHGSQRGVVLLSVLSLMLILSVLVSSAGRQMHWLLQTTTQGTNQAREQADHRLLVAALLPWMWVFCRRIQITSCVAGSRRMPAFDSIHRCRRNLSGDLRSWNSRPMAPSENSLGVGCANAAQDLMRWQRFGLAHLHCHEVVHSALLNASICPSKVCRVA